MKNSMTDIYLSPNLLKLRQSFFSKKFFSQVKYVFRRCVCIGALNMLLCVPALADYTIASGTTINASTITGQSGVLTINGTLLLNSNQTLSGFTSVIINAPNGQIYWDNNADITFAAGTTIVINNSAPGLQPTLGNGNSSQRLYIGTTLISVSSDNSNIAAFSFEQFNSLGGTPQFNLTYNSSVCAGGPVSLKYAPDKTSSTVTYDYAWSIATSSATFSPGSSNSSTTYDSVSISPAVGNYTISCSVSSNGKTLDTKSVTITVSSIPAAPTPVAATPSHICSGSSSNLTATSSGNTIYWYTAASGGSNIGYSTSQATFSVAPLTTKTYYAEAQSAVGCKSTTRTSATITLNNPVTITTQPATNSFCPGSSPSISVAATGTSVTYQWQLSTTVSSGSFTNISADTTFSGVTAATLNIANPAVSLSSNFYRVVVAGACGAVNSNTVALKYSNVWMGTNSTDWNTSGNWSDGNLPSTACTNVYIPKRTNQPTLNSTPVPTITNLVIDSGAVLTLTNATLNIAGCITNNGSFDATNGSVNFIGNTMQTIAGSSLAANTIKELIVSNTAGITIAASANDSLNITGKLSFGSVNNAAINTNDNLVLVSNAAGTARVADITNSGANSGNKFVGKVSVQRYFPARRSWRLFTAPLAKAGSIFDYLQNGGNYAAGKGTYVSGANPSTANGLDLSPFNNTSLKEGSNLTPVTNTKTAMLSKNSADTSDNKAYFIFVRGDRTAINFNPPYSDITTLNSKGNLQTGRQTFSASSSLNAFTLIGNPYASPVDFRKLTRNNILNRVYVWDPYLNSEQGGYITLDDVNNTGTYDIHPQSPGGLNQIIQSGQAFFVQTATANPASLVFQENAKADTAANRTAFRSMNFMPALQIELYQLNTDNSKVLADGTFAQFDKSFDKRVTFQDALKFGNVKEMLSLQRDNKNMIIERRPLIQNNDTLFLQLTKTTQRNYRLQFDPENMDPGLTAFLEDSYTGTKTPVNTVATSVYDFVINGAAASAAANRFKIIFKQINSIVLPVTYSRINAYQQASNIAVEWTVENEVNISKYEVEKSTDAINYAKVNTTAAIGANRSTTDYKWLDKNPVNGNNYYRVRSVSPDGKYEYSKVVLVKITNAASGIRIYPNPVTDGIITAEFKNMKEGIYQTRLLDVAGQIVMTQEIHHSTGTSIEKIKMPHQLAAGIYQLEVTTPDKKITNKKVIVK
jgi:hypothetical protein